MGEILGYLVFEVVGYFLGRIVLFPIGHWVKIESFDAQQDYPKGARRFFRFTYDKMGQKYFYTQTIQGVGVMVSLLLLVLIFKACK